MKKMLMLVLIFGAASMANATVQMYVNGVHSDATTTPSGNLTLGIWTNTAISAAGSTLWALVAQTGVGTVSGGSYVGPLGSYYDPAFEDMRR